MVIHPKISVGVGTWLVNNDKRFKGKRIRIEEIQWDGPDAYAIYTAGRRRARIRVETIKQPGQPTHQQGWSIEDPNRFDVV